MKILLPLILATVLAVPAFAAYTGPGQQTPGGFKGPESGSQASNVAEALKLPDDARISLTGNIVSKLTGAKDEYMFKDSTGEIQVEISNKIFRALGVDVTPETRVRISGKMDKDFAKNPEIEVKYMEILK